MSREKGYRRQVSHSIDVIIPTSEGKLFTRHGLPRSLVQWPRQDTDNHS